MASENIYVPIIVVVYLFLMVWYSTIMAKVLNTNLALLIIVGIFLPPVWLIFALISLAYQSQENSKEKNSESKKSPKKNPKKISKKK